MILIATNYIKTLYSSASRSIFGFLWPLPPLFSSFLMSRARRLLSTIATGCVVAVAWLLLKAGR
jgi:hypothetical protein